MLYTPPDEQTRIDPIADLHHAELKGPNVVNILILAGERLLARVNKIRVIACET